MSESFGQRIDRHGASPLADEETGAYCCTGMGLLPACAESAYVLLGIKEYIDAAGTDSIRDPICPFKCRPPYTV